MAVQLQDLHSGSLFLITPVQRFLYALYMVMYNMPKVIAPTLAGPYLIDFPEEKQFLSGVFAIFLPQRTVVSGFMILSLLAAVVIMGGNRKSVEKIYNRCA